jgi:putative ABC transport system permease protein
MLYTLTIVAGVAALVAIRSFATNLTSSVDTEAKVLLGADLELYRRSPLGDEVAAIAARFGGEQAAQVAFGSMIYFPASGDSRLVSIRAPEPGYPFYGELQTDPLSAASDYRATAGALVDRTLMLQFGAQVGDMVRVGEVTLPIAGALERIPGEVPTASLVGPRVFIPHDLIEQTGLLRPGSRATYSLYFRLDDTPEEVVEQVEAMRPELRALDLEVETVQYRRRLVGRALDNLYDFLYLAGFAALLLGGIGVASAVSLHARRKVPDVAVLRCLGAPPRAPMYAFLLQAAAMGIVGATGGIALGLIAQAALPRAVDAFLPLPVAFAISWSAIAEGFGVGLVTSLLFAALPLVSLRRVSPLRALRLFADRSARPARDPWVWALLALLLLAAVGMAGLHTGNWRLALGLTAGLLGAVAVLAGVAWLLRAGARAAVPTGATFPLRQGVANLYRPNNQTTLVLLALGFGALVLATLVILQGSLLATVRGAATTGEANFVLFDVQPDQLEGIRELMLERGAPVLQQTPVVPMRLSRLGDRAVSEIGDEEGIRPWVLRREYNSTYRAGLADTETIVDGEWIGTASMDDEFVAVSLEESIAGDLKLSVGDTLEFDVQGVRIAARVASLREVDWQQVRPNFFVLFPAGVLEPAPQQIVVVSRVESAEASASLQRGIVESYTNVSVLDLGLVLQTVDSVLDQIAQAIRFMTLFVVGAGAAVLLVAVRLSREQRQQEGILLRTLGASRRQIVSINAVEYAILGVLSALGGVGLAMVGAWILTRTVFESELVLEPLPLLGIFAGVVLLTFAVGMWGTRGITARPPLEVLRNAG